MYKEKKQQDKYQRDWIRTKRMLDKAEKIRAERVAQGRCPNCEVLVSQVPVHDCYSKLNFWTDRNKEIISKE